MPEEKAFQQQGVHSPLEQKPSHPILCHQCGKACKGEVLRVQNKHFHIKCFVCKVCGCDLAQGGFFVRQGEYICTVDYQRLYGTRCFSCDQFIEGEVVSALGKTYHPRCFVCAVCKQPFPAGDRVTFNGKECICQKCTQPLPDNSPAPIQAVRNCCGCGKEFKNEQSLVALDKHWHLGCFKCRICNKVLNAEYISKDGVPYCEVDYHAMYGIQCENCKKYITGRVLEAGDKHYHPTCARCARCDQMFGEGEEMYLQGSSIWHPPCRQAARMEEKNKVTRTSSESITSAPASSASGSPNRVIYAKLGDELLDYKDLAALPKVKAIYNIDRPDMLTYSPYISYSADERHHGEVCGPRFGGRSNPAPSGVVYLLLPFIQGGFSGCHCAGLPSISSGAQFWLLILKSMLLTKIILISTLHCFLFPSHCGKHDYVKDMLLCATGCLKVSLICVTRLICFFSSVCSHCSCFLPLQPRAMGKSPPGRGGPRAQAPTALLGAMGVTLHPAHRRTTADQVVKVGGAPPAYLPIQTASLLRPHTCRHPGISTYQTLWAKTISIGSPLSTGSMLRGPPGKKGMIWTER
uniref:Actin binding LIM protein family member 2 n=1 Tax=Scleropages formosus TaxID=113540 RepID=A0A8C9SGV1_SCLFO